MHVETVPELKVKIGLEVHCQLTNLKSKLFCSCSADYRDSEPNTHICPVCMGMPGTLPVLNRKAVEDAIMIALALNMQVSSRTLFYRKNYFYPDMPKNFQISQYDRAGGVPIAKDGYVTIDGGRKVRISRLQLEEDPGKLVYEGTIETSKATLVDYNRAGVALAEIVTEPDITSPREARIFLQKLRSILEHLGVSSGELEGSMRCDANISIEGGTRVEVKNISSFKEVERALNFEMTRQRSLIRKGLRIGRETRHWDELRRVTVTLRVKEEEEDYRYFPEPDLVPILISREDVERLRASMPELPDSRKRRLMEQYGISMQNAEVLTDNKALAEFFEACAANYSRPDLLSNWIVGDLLSYLYDMGLELRETKLTPQHMVGMLRLIDDGTISGKIGKEVLKEIMVTGEAPENVVKARGLIRISDREYLERLTDRVFEENPKAVKDALKDEKAVRFLVGQLMKLTEGKADPQLANILVRNRLKASAGK
ncbi:Asp-tRNA(Asn)/Glu-tRNA(Gln) amidotransferase subunit GatB [Candidatus Bathyarchaeota archaeon]|nr:Asp-tRNA(Asn)/Glu-tRNA(Gln) amidotransferase subunit GatB [Candidatus Bathyarchaeota archaeon]MBS7629389.1 Asp-tRNA(Asn)/Glu-tRNA(Gln) amidotransferase subunit GatB [Candidatus Bathyarchaeota archaeon]